MKIGNRIWCYDDPPPQGLSKARRGRELVTKSPRGRPFGGGDVYRNWGYGGLNPHHHTFKDCDFHGKSIFSRHLLIPCNGHEGDPLFPPRGEAAQGEHPLDPLFIQVSANSLFVTIAMMRRFKEPSYPHYTDLPSEAPMWRPGDPEKGGRYPPEYIQKNGKTVFMLRV
jgi:hypothetical protein